VLPLIASFILALGVGEAASLRRNDTSDLNIINKILAKMTVEQKLGQMFMVGFSGHQVSGQPIERLIKEAHIGSIILFEGNIRDMRAPKLAEHDYYRIPEYVAALTNSLQEATPFIDREQSIRLPLMIAVDQENGSTIIVEKGITLLPGNISIGQTRDANLAFASGEVTGTELRAMGITMDLAPVMDVNTNAANDIVGDRTFGGHIGIVVPLGVAFMKGLHAGGVVAVGKHFPGHGDSQDDPHFTLPLVMRTRNDLLGTNVPPFTALVEQGIGAIMTSHIWYKNMTGYPNSDVPFSLDSKTIKSEIRTRLRFDGVILTDDMLMKAATPRGVDLTTAIDMAITAGNDVVVLAGADTDALLKIIKRLANQYRDSQNRIDESVRRVLLLKMRINKSLNATQWRVNLADLPRVIRSPEHLTRAREIAAESIVALSDSGAEVSDVSRAPHFGASGGPLAAVPVASTILVVSPVFRRDEFTEQLRKVTTHDFSKRIRLLYHWGRIEDARQVLDGDSNDAVLIRQASTSGSFNEEDLEAAERKVVEAAKNGAQGLIFGLAHRAHARLLQRVIKALPTLPTFVVSFREPYYVPQDVLQARNVVTLVAGSNISSSIEAVVRVLRGEVPPKPIDFVTVSVGDWVDRGRNLGAPVVNLGEKRRAVGAASILSQNPLPVNVGGLFGMSWAEVAKYLCVYVAGALGATASLIVSGTFPGAFLFARGAEGNLKAGFAPRVVAQGAFGVILYLVASLAGPSLMSMFAAPTSLDSPSVYILLGFVGGFLGERLLSVILTTKG